MKIWKRILENADTSLVADVDEILNIMADPSITTILEKNYLIGKLYETYRNECNWVVLPEILFTSHAGIGLPKSSPYFDRFSNM